MPKGKTAKNPAPVPYARPKLRAVRVTADTQEAFAGEFQRVVDWRLEHVTGPGLIVQHVTKRWNIFDIANGVPLVTAAQVDAYVAPSGGETRLGAGWDDYTEAWVVARNATSPTSADSFSLAAIVPAPLPASRQDTTRGWFEIDGEAYFHPTPGIMAPNPTAYGFNGGNPNNAANGLPWVLNGPPPGLPPAVTNGVFRSVKVKWDTSVQDSNGEWGPTIVVRSST